MTIRPTAPTRAGFLPPSSLLAVIGGACESSPFALRAVLRKVTDQRQRSIHGTGMDEDSVRSALNALQVVSNRRVEDLTVPFLMIHRSRFKIDKL